MDSDVAGPLAVRQFERRVRDEADKARANPGFKSSGHHPEADNIPLSEWLTITTEELGKLTRSVNKLMIAVDPAVRRSWRDEGYHRIVTTSAMLERLALRWYDYA